MTAPRNLTVCGLDLGQAKDPTAFCVLESTPDLRQVQVRHLEQFPLDRPYTEYVRTVADRMRHPALVHATLVIDYTGVGRPVYDMFVATRLRPIGVTITAGEKWTRRGRIYRVPKRDLASTILTMLQTERLEISSHLPHAQLLVKELLNFRMKITTRANDTYEAWREGDHDDLVLATAVAGWYLEHGPRRLSVPAADGEAPTFAPPAVAGPPSAVRPLAHVLRRPRFGRIDPLGTPIRRPGLPYPY